MSDEARKPCLLVTSAYASVEDLETVNRLRGLSLVECDSRRALAVAGHDREHALEDEQARLRAERRRPLWKKLTPWRER